MPRFAAGLEYDGRAYSGWQVQPGLNTVQDVVQRAFSRVADSPVDCICAGRTDAGVHALAQVVHFDSEAARSERGWRLGANTYLPADVSVAWVREVPGHFHARYSALARSYRYLILNRDSRSALARRARHLGAAPARRGAHARRGAGAGGRTRLQRVSRHRMPGEVSGAPRRAPDGDARRRVGDAGNHRQCLPASHGPQYRRAADGDRAR